MARVVEVFDSEAGQIVEILSMGMRNVRTRIEIDRTHAVDFGDAAFYERGVLHLQRHWSEKPVSIPILRGPIVTEKT